MLGFYQLVDERGGGGESDPALLLAGGHGEAREQMGVPLSPTKMMGSARVRKFVNLLRRDLRFS
jgi:hypothetical protein